MSQSGREMGLCGELWMVEKAIQKEGCIKVRWKMAVSQPSWKHNWVNWGDMGYVVFIVICLFVIAIIHKVFCQLRMNHHTTLRLTKNFVCRSRLLLYFQHSATYKRELFNYFQGKPPLSLEHCYSFCSDESTLRSLTCSYNVPSHVFPQFMALSICSNENSQAKKAKKL